jgi:branched-chain amino acid transport system substrate-binding protein
VVFGSLMDHGSDAHLTRERAIRLAVKQASAAGGLEGRSLALVMCDIRESPELDNLTRTAAAVASASFLSKTLGVSAIIGPSASTDTEQVWQVARGGSTLVISPAATSPALTALEMSSSDEQPGLLWRTAPPDSIQGRVIAEDLLARKVMRAHVIRESGAYGEGLAAVFSDHYRQGGGALQLASLLSESQIPEVVAGVPADDGVESPAEVLFISSQQAWIASFLKAAAASPAFARRSVFLTDAAANQAVLSAAAGSDSLYPRVRGTRPAPRSPEDFVYASFVADFQAEYSGQSPAGATFSPHAYDAAWLTLYGAAWSLLQKGAVTGPGIAGGLRRVSAGGLGPTPILPASWPVVVAAFRAGRDINVSGASGELDYNAVTRELDSPIEIWTIGPAPEGGAFMLVPVETRTR